MKVLFFIFMILSAGLFVGSRWMNEKNKGEGNSPLLLGALLKGDYVSLENGIKNTTDEEELQTLYFAKQLLYGVDYGRDFAKPLLYWFDVFDKESSKEDSSMGVESLQEFVAQEKGTKKELALAFWLLGRYELGRGNISVSEAMFRKGVLLNPDGVLMRLDLMWLYLSQGKGDDARVLLGEKIPDEVVGITVARALLMASSFRNLRQVMESLNEIPEGQPPHIIAQMKLARVFARYGFEGHSPNRDELPEVRNLKPVLHTLLYLFLSSLKTEYSVELPLSDTSLVGRLGRRVSRFKLEGKVDLQMNPRRAEEGRKCGQLNATPCGEINRNSFWVHYWRGRFFWQSGKRTDFLQAKDSFKKAWSAAPEHWGAELWYEASRIALKERGAVRKMRALRRKLTNSDVAWVADEARKMAQ